MGEDAIGVVILHEGAPSPLISGRSVAGNGGKEANVTLVWLARLKQRHSGVSRGSGRGRGEDEAGW